MIEKMLRRLFPWTIKFIETKATWNTQENLMLEIIHGKNQVIYELPNERYVIGIIERSKSNA